jgi:DNA-binding transcriptional LysR family regulator
MKTGTLLFLLHLFFAPEMKKVDLRQITYFIAVAEEGQFTAAAQNLHISQPPLSHQIKLLEEELGLQLLERGRRNVQLTDAGQTLYNRAKQIIDLVSITKKELADLKSGLHGTLNIAAVVSSDTTILLKLIQNFHKAYPEVNYRLSEGETSRVIELLKNGVSELGIIRTPFSSEDFESLYLTDKSDKEPMVAIEKSGLANNDEVLKIGSTIPLTLIKNKPLIIHQRYENKIRGIFTSKGIEPKIFCVSDDIRSMLTWAENGLGTAIVPKLSVQSVQREQLTIHEIEEGKLKTGSVLIWPKHRYLSISARHFIQICKQTLGASYPLSNCK